MSAAARSAAEGPPAPSVLDAFYERKQRVVGTMRELSALAAALGAPSLRDRIERDLVRKLDEDRFHLVVVGEFNHGKSTFVNALLGAQVLPVGVTPTTAAIHHIRYAPEQSAAIVYVSGAREPIGFDEVGRFSVGGARQSDAIDYIEIGYPAPVLHERILLVDTPGVNDLSLQRADITYSYIPRADAVLFLLDAGQILKESERVFLEQKLLKASRDKIIFVITKWDLLTADEQSEALDYARTQLAKLMTTPAVLPVSAELARGGALKESGMPELLAYVTDFLARERGRILLDNAAGDGLGVFEMIGRGIEAQLRALTLKLDELDRRIGLLEHDLESHADTREQRRMRIREEVRGIQVGARKDLDRFVDDVVRQLPHIIESANTDDLKQYLPMFLEDTVKRWAEAESAEIAGQLELLAERTIALVRGDVEEADERLFAMLDPDIKRLDVRVDTFGYDVGIFALFTVGLGMMFANALVGGLLALAAPLAALVVRDRVDAEYRKRLMEVGPEVLREAAAQLGPRMDAMIAEVGRRLDEWVVSASEELHREVVEMLRSLRQARTASDQDDTALRDSLEERRREGARLRARLEAIRAEVWSE